MSIVDYSGTNPDYICPSETWLLTQQPNAYNCIIPINAPFHRKDLILANPETGQTLIEGIDFSLCLQYKEATVGNGGIYGGVMLHSGTGVRFEVYRTLSPMLTLPRGTLDRFLYDPALRDPRNIDWVEVTRYPVILPPQHDVEDVESAADKDEILKSLIALDNIRTDRNVAEVEAISQLTQNINTEVTRIKLGRHLTHAKEKSAHSLTTELVGALPRLDTADSTIRLSGRDYDQIAAIVQSLGPRTHTNINLYRDAGVLLGHLSPTVGGTFKLTHLTNEIAVGDASIDTVLDGGLHISGEDGVSIGSLSMRNGFASIDKSMVITTDTISRYYKPGKVSYGPLTFTQSTEVSVTGTGTVLDPYTINLTIPPVNPEEPRPFKLENIFSDSKENIATQRQVNEVNDQVAEIVPIAIMFNGQTPVQSGNIDLSLATLGLDKLNNTTPAGKPVTTAMTAVTATKSILAHTHRRSDVTDVPIATDTVTGLVKTSTVVSADDTVAVMSSTGKTVLAALKNRSGVAGGKFSRDNWDFSSYVYKTAAIGVDGKSLVLASPQEIWTSDTLHTLPPTTIDIFGAVPSPENSVLFLTVTMNDPDWTYNVTRSTEDGDLLVGVIYTGPVNIVKFELFDTGYGDELACDLIHQISPNDHRGIPDGITLKGENLDTDIGIGGDNVYVTNTAILPVQERLYYQGSADCGITFDSVTTFTVKAFKIVIPTDRVMGLHLALRATCANASTVLVGESVSRPLNYHFRTSKSVAGGVTTFTVKIIIDEFKIPKIGTVITVDWTASVNAPLAYVDKVVVVYVADTQWTDVPDVQMGKGLRSLVLSEGYDYVSLSHPIASVGNPTLLSASASLAAQLKELALSYTRIVLIAVGSAVPVTLRATDTNSGLVNKFIGVNGAYKLQDLPEITKEKAMLYSPVLSDGDPKVITVEHALWHSDGATIYPNSQVMAYTPEHRTVMGVGDVFNIADIIGADIMGFISGQ